MPKYPVLILGGGFAGAYCARALVRQLGEKASQEVALLADQNFILFHPMLAEVSGSAVSPLHVLNPLRRFCRGVSFLLGKVRDIDLEQKTVRFSPGPFVRDETIGFDQLVLALGGVVDVSRVPGMPEHGFLMKTVGDAIALRTGVLSRLEQASVTSERALRRRLLTFVTVGGGYSGVETAAQIHGLVRHAQRDYPALSIKDFRFILIHSGPYLMNQIGEELGRYAEAHLRARGIEILLNRRVKAITAERAILDNGEVIETNLVITTVGNGPHPVLTKLIKRYNLPNEKGRILTEPTLRVQGQEFVWAAGDCAAVPSGGGVASATAQFAMRQGTHLGKNLLQVQRGGQPRPFKYRSLGEMASLGHRNAVGKVLGFQVSGLPGWLLWRVTYLYKLPSIEDKIRVGFEWSLEAIFPRDITLLDIKTTEVLGRVHLEQGDPVYHRGDTAFSFYIIEKGKIEISDADGPVRTLTAGEHFGEREMLQCTPRQFEAKAVEPSTLIALDQRTFEALTEHSRALGMLLHRSAVQYLTNEERHGLVQRLNETLRSKLVEEFMVEPGGLIRTSMSVAEALEAFHEVCGSMLPLLDDDSRPKGWVRLDFVLDYLHQGKVTGEGKATDLLVTPGTSVTPKERIDDALLKFARTTDREFFVVDGDNRLIGTLRLLDVLIAQRRLVKEDPAMAHP